MFAMLMDLVLSKEIKNIIVDRGDVIDNDSEIKTKLNDSAEIEKMIQEQINFQETLLSNRDSLSSSENFSNEEEDFENINNNDILKQINPFANNHNNNNDNMKMKMKNQI